MRITPFDPSLPVAAQSRLDGHETARKPASLWPRWTYASFQARRPFVGSVEVNTRAFAPTATQREPEAHEMS